MSRAQRLMSSTEPPLARSGSAAVGLPRDGLTAAIVALLAASIVFLFVTEPGQAGIDRDGDLLGVALIAAMLLPLLWWRSAPLTSLLLPALAAVTAIVLGYAAGLAQLAVFCAVGAAAWSTDARTSLLLGLGGGLVVLLVFSDDDFGGASPLNLLVGFGVGTLPAAVGHALRVQRALAQQARDHSLRLERLQELEVQRAVAEERVRIAREVHDVVGHHLSAIKLQTGAAKRTMARDPAAAAAAVDTIGASATEALGETRRMLGLLRAAELELRPAPRIDDLSSLVDIARNAGIEVRIEVDGAPVPLTDAVQSTAYRIVQEALTNVARHVGPTTAVVRVAYTPDRLRVTVRDPGRTMSAPPAGTSGHGLLGMRERAALVGGTVTAGPTPDGGWLVDAELPTTLPL